LRTRQIEPAAVTVGSKWGYTYTADWQVQATQHEVKAHTLPVLQHQWQASQQEVGTWLRLYQVHSATLESGIFENRAVLNELARLKADGLLIGLSLSGAQQAATLERALAITVDGVPLFGCVQATWNLLEPSVGPALQAAYIAGWGVIVKEALANGRLTMRNLAPDFVPKLALLQAQAHRLHTTVDALALAAVLAQPWADVVLSGATTVAQLHSNLAALQVLWDEEAAHALGSFTESAQSYWQTRSKLAWN
jgi:aryl-alcohol dehydrogenase-like predicted oxidoreductase